MNKFSTTLKYQKDLLKILLGVNPAGRFVDLREDDIWLVSYPKSGNTWLRFLLGNLVVDETVDFLSLEKVFPDIHVNSFRYLSRLHSPRMLKSHYPYEWGYRKVIYIVRDPRDIIISYWMHQKKTHKIPLDYPLDLFGDSFLKGKLPFGSWYEHVGSWLGARNGSENFALIRYEDLLINTKYVLEYILSEIKEFPTIKKDIYNAISLSNFNKMKELEKKQELRWKPIKKSLLNIKFVREGKSGQWRNYLPRPLVNTIWKQWGKLMMQLGYEE